MEETQFGEINISSAWQKVIFNLLQRLEQHERFCREGCNELAEYFTTNSSLRTESQIKALQMMITDTKILLSNIYPTINKEFHKSQRDTLDLVEKLISENPERLKRVVRKEGYNEKRSEVTLGNQFNKLLSLLTSIRNNCVIELSEIGFLFPKKKVEVIM